MKKNILIELDLLSSLETYNNYPYNLNDKLIDNIISTKKELELEYIKNYKIPIYKEKNKNYKIKGSYEATIYIY